MKECVMETKSVAYFLDPLLIGETDPWQQLSAGEESCLVETLRHNKVVMNFEKRLESDSILKERIFNTFSRVKALCDEVNLKGEKDSNAFRGIKQEFSENKIEFMLIKSDGYFPYESDNLDILIKPNKLAEVAKLLKKAGYSELPIVREWHKYLFRNICTPDVLPLHIHTIVEWEAQFADSAFLWHRSKISKNDGGFSIPSPEDCILITCAHLFFENHEVKLADLFKITSKLRNCNINWDYMFDHAKKFQWSDAFCLTMLLVDLVHKNLCGRSMLPHLVFSRMEETNHRYFQLFQKTLKPFSSGCKPLIIPYAVATFFFIQRVLRESNLPLARRLKQVDQIASNVLRERIVRPKRLPFSVASE